MICTKCGNSIDLTTSFRWENGHKELPTYIKSGICLRCYLREKGKKKNRLNAIERFSIGVLAVIAGIMVVLMVTH